ncbi:MAG TPA: alpha/beta hydrolase [Ramlibacter sp.]|nr:alpha/beta hydrolase [Ramlibacter sp.]
MDYLQTIPSPFKAPPLSLLAMEPVRAMFDFCTAKLGTPAQAVGDGHAVIVFPGLGGTPFTTAHLRGFLKQSGFDAHCWGRGINTGPEGEFDDWLGALEQQVRQLHGTTGRNVSLVGWSLGGIYARELAKRAPDAVRQVITLGTPFAAMHGATHAEGIYKLLNGSLNGANTQLTPQLQERLRQCPPVPTTSVYSKSDGVVSWRGCIERRTERSESVEVTAGHLGMATHPEVLRIVANRLAQPQGQWKPLRRRERLGT